MITDLAPTIIWTRNNSNQVTYINKYWYEFTGTEDTGILDDSEIKEIIHPDDLPVMADAWNTAVAGKCDYFHDIRIRRHDGKYIWFKSHGIPILNDDGEVEQWMGSAIVTQEIKDAEACAINARAEMEAQFAERTAELQTTNAQLLQEIGLRQVAQDALRQSQKMEAVGQLTGGIAHDFNNMLTVIIGNLEIMKMSLPSLGQNVISERLDRNAHMALEAATKAEKLTAQLLAFSRKSRLHLDRLNANEVILGIKDMIQRTIGSSSTCRLDLQDDVWLCLSDRIQLESAIINLCINARDAMPTGGEIVIWTKNSTLRSPDGSQARYVTVGVTDTGEGMTQEVKDKAFDPFFTTKDVGKGSGLGLSMIYGFTQQSNGKVFLQSEVGKGTTIEMIFPYSAGETIQETNVEEDAVYDFNKKTILVVDDEPAVRELAATLLSDLGYNVLSASDGRRAIEIIKDPTVHLDLLFTDVVMPNGIDGFDVAKVAQRLRPTMPIIFTTGYADVAIQELKKDLTQKIKILGKPYRLNELSQMVAKELR
jgi:PAS domain S-box-containing protein